MPSLEEIKKQITAIDDTSRLLESKEVKELPNIFSEDEHIEQIIQCTQGNNGGVLVGTNKRLVFVSKGIMSGLIVDDFPAYNKITDVSYKTGILMGEMTIRAPMHIAIVEYIDKAKTSIFGEFVRAKVKAVAESNSPVQIDDVVSKLERLAVLKTQGILTEAEFLEQKRKILNG